jgi:hypothetical protein
VAPSTLGDGGAGAQTLYLSNGGLCQFTASASGVHGTFTIEAGTTLGGRSANTITVQNRNTFDVYQFAQPLVSPGRPLL